MRPNCPGLRRQMLADRALRDQANTRLRSGCGLRKNVLQDGQDLWGGGSSVCCLYGPTLTVFPPSDFSPRCSWLWWGYTRQGSLDGFLPLGRGRRGIVCVPRESTPTLGIIPSVVPSATKVGETGEPSFSCLGYSTTLAAGSSLPLPPSLGLGFVLRFSTAAESMPLSQGPTW